MLVAKYLKLLHRNNREAQNKFEVSREQDLAVQD